MRQLIQPNLLAVGYPDYCLAYVEAVFNAPNIKPSAWEAWEACEFPHTDPIPNDVSVPVWFSWTGTVDGETRNWGHVAVSTPNGVYTNPLSGSGHKVFASVPALASAYGVTYVGWSEDVSTLKVIGDDMAHITTEMRVALALGTIGTQPQDPGEVGWDGKEDQQSFDDMITKYSSLGQARQVELQTQIDQLTKANLKLTDQLNTLKNQPIPSDPDTVVVTKDGFWQALLKFLGKG